MMKMTNQLISTIFQLGALNRENNSIEMAMITLVTLLKFPVHLLEKKTERFSQKLLTLNKDSGVEPLDNDKNSQPNSDGIRSKLLVWCWAISAVWSLRIMLPSISATLVVPSGSSYGGWYR